MAKKKSYRGTIRIDGRLIQQSFATSADRSEWYGKMRSSKMRLIAGLETEFEPLEIERVAANFLVSRKDNETVKHDKYRLEHYFLPALQGRMIHAISRKDWKEMLSDLPNHGDECACERSLSGKTINNIRTMLSQLYKFAIQDEPRRALTNPINEIPPCKYMRPEMKFFHTAEECSRYLNHARAIHPVFGVFASIALNTGMREGEITSLSWECVDLERRTISIRRAWSHSTRKIVNRTKGKRERIIGINKPLYGVLSRHRGNAEPSALVVPNGIGGSWESKHLWEIHCKVLEAAKLETIRIHDLRHTYATQYLANGGDIYDLSKGLGHQSIKTTEQYAHVIPARVQSRAGVVEVR